MQIWSNLKLNSMGFHHPKASTTASQHFFTPKSTFKYIVHMYVCVCLCISIVTTNMRTRYLNLSNWRLKGFRLSLKCQCHWYSQLRCDGKGTAVPTRCIQLATRAVWAVAVTSLPCQGAWRRKQRFEILTLAGEQRQVCVASISPFGNAMWWVCCINVLLICYCCCCISFSLMARTIRVINIKAGDD